MELKKLPSEIQNVINELNPNSCVGLDVYRKQVN